MAGAAGASPSVTAAGASPSVASAGAAGAACATGSTTGSGVVTTGAGISPGGEDSIVLNAGFIPSYSVPSTPVLLLPFIIAKFSLVTCTSSLKKLFC